MSDEQNRQSIFPEAPESDNDIEDRQASRTDGTVSPASSKKKPIATISAVPITYNSILEGAAKFINPGLIDVSIAGWFGTPTSNGELELKGNNIHVVDGKGKTVVSRNGGKFDQVYDTKLDAADPKNREASMANVFYVANLYHDVMYKYGFTEKSSNFQNNTFSRGGHGGDAITSYVQSSDGTNNAFFSTPVDGKPGVMRFLLWSNRGDTIRRDTAVDNNIVIHELTHGLSNRLTGGKGIANCLQVTESRGLGEGWSDTLAWWATTTDSMDRTKNMVMAAYASNSKNGIRRYPYSTNINTNPLTYKNLNSETFSHVIGTVWSTMLYEVYWNMVDQRGFEKDKMNVRSRRGNIKFLQNVVDGMKLQPCNPTMVSARDAILAADRRNTRGFYVCAIWRAFAKRGLGAGAKAGVYVNDFTLGDGCRPK
ncbi:peptidase M36 [Chytridium lagenaria]|nr:peptidase M36 [Chytridium lagenaria]